MAKEILCSFGVDVDAVAGWLGSYGGEDSTLDISRGLFAEARNAIERAIAIDSATEPVERQACRLCDDLGQLSTIYAWWDSLAAVDRTAHRYLRLRPGNARARAARASSGIPTTKAMVPP